MKITKLGHCCLLIEVNGKRILTDPGTYTTAETKNLSNIDLVVISHEHGDHFHAEAVKDVLASSPKASVVANSAVGKLLAELGVAHTVVEGKDAQEVAGIALAACDAKHEEIFEDFGMVQNTGYMIADKLFYPGDAYAEPGVPVDVLALPVAGPWCKISDAIRYALRVKPRAAFPVHDGMLKEGNMMHKMLGDLILSPRGVEFVSMSAGDTKEF